MIQQESRKSVKGIPRRSAHGSRRQHFSPAFSNKYWASGGKLRVYALGVDGTVRSNDIPARSWGCESFLYSQELERLLSLVESDAAGPYKKLLGMVPLSEDETKRWVAYLAVQCIRTPAFIVRLLPSVDVHQLVEPAALFRSLSRGGRLDEIVDAEVVFAGVLEDGEALAAHVLLRGRDPQIGNGFHGLTMEYGFWYFI